MTTCPYHPDGSCGIPFGLCHCSCGQPTRVPIVSHKPHGQIKGQPLRFINLHSPRGTKKAVQQNEHERRDDIQTAMTITKLAERMNPSRAGFSPKMTAILGAILGHDYGVTDSRGGRLTSISITSDGFVIAGSTASDGGGAFIGGASDLDRNLAQLLNALKLTKAETAAFMRVYTTRVRDWRGGVVV